ncbi:MAG TPA: hypothetical protein EYG07_01525 [Alphaproteobacteria bacterium]|nr:hypothetical protein [Alphaproteobacteria bacterium]
MDDIMKKYSSKISDINNFIWKIAELGLAIASAGLVLFLLLGESSGAFPKSVAENFTEITNSLGAKGITAILAAAVFFLISKRLIDKK